MALEYWISPECEIVTIDEHPIKTIVKQPELFGYKLDEMQIIYAKYADENEAEGEATKVAISDLLEKGWIYCHRRNENGYWVAEVLRLDKRTRKNIQVWIQQLVSNSDIDESSQLRIFRHLRNLKTKKTFQQILDGDFFS